MPSWMPQITQDQLSGTLRWLVSNGCIWLVARGYLTDDQVVQVLAMVTPIAMLLWMLYSRRQNGLILSANAQPKVDKIVLHDQATADAMPPNVVGPVDVAARDVAMAATRP